MKNKFKEITIIDYGTENGAHYHAVALSYQVFGKPLGEAPVVLVVHALTGNSTVAGEDGWWSKIIGDDKVIDTQKYSVLAFDVPGNCFNEYVIDKYKNFTARDIAKIFCAGLKSLGVSSVTSFPKMLPAKLHSVILTFLAISLFSISKIKTGSIRSLLVIFKTSI